MMDAAAQAVLRENEPFLDAVRQWGAFKRATGLMNVPPGSEWEVAQEHLDDARKAYLRAFAEDVLVGAAGRTG
jgi:hypothetical protein